MNGIAKMIENRYSMFERAKGVRTGMGRSVAIIEDEQNIIEAVSFLLEREGWRVFSHGNGATAVDFVQNKKPDLLILDVMLPGKSGFEILSDLRSGVETESLPILMLTAKGQAKAIEKAESLGVSRFISKPFSNQEILEIANELISE